MAEPNRAAINPFGAKFIVRTSDVVVAELSPAGRTYSELNWWLHHIVVGAHGAVIWHGGSPVAGVPKIPDVRAERVSAWVRHEERQNPIIRRNAAKSISRRTKPNPAPISSCAFVYTVRPRSTHELIGSILVGGFVRELWVKLNSVFLVVIGPLVSGVEPESVNRNHASILPLVSAWREHAAGQP
jgi:hypothetical protein